MRQFDEDAPWDALTEDLDRISADMWPGIAVPAPEVTSVKGKEPKKPPLTSDAIRALDDIVKICRDYHGRLIGLFERALKGLAFKAHRMGSLEDEALWRDDADEARRQEAIRAAHRTGKGEWIAARRHPRRSRRLIARRHVVTENVRCASRTKVIEAGRRLIAEKAEWRSEGTFIEVSSCSVLEWVEQGN